MKLTAKSPDQLEAEYLKHKAALRADSGLSWEKKELAVKALGDEYYRRRRELESDAA